MTLRNYTIGNVSGYPATGLNFQYRKEAVLDFAEDNQTAADVAAMIDVGDGEIVLLVALEVLTVGGATLTIDVGDGSNVDGYLDGVNGNLAGGFYVSMATYTNGTGDLDVATANHAQLLAIMGGKLYAADDTIDLLINNTNAVAKLRLSALVIDLHGTAIRGNTVVT